MTGELACKVEKKADGDEKWWKAVAGMTMAAAEERVAMETDKAE